MDFDPADFTFLSFYMVKDLHGQIYKPMIGF